jgi:hypothetical protein
MKKQLTLWLISMFISYLAAAQDGANDEKLNFQTLKLGSSPAFILLGVEPENIQRPGTPTAFITALQNAVTDNKIQPNLAFELSPYYLFKKPDNTAINRFDPRKYLLDQPDVITTIIRTATISLGTSATSENSFGDLQKGTGLGLGLRFQLIGGNAGDAYQNFNYYFLKNDVLLKLKNEIENSGANLNLHSTFLSVTNKFFTEDLPAMKNHYLSKKGEEKLRKELKELENEINKKGSSVDNAKVVLSECERESAGFINKNLFIVNKPKPLAKQGFMLEFAAGQAYVFENDAFNSGRHARSALWLVPSFRWDVNKSNDKMSLLDIMFVGRYTFNNQRAGVDKANYLDAGTKIAFTRNKLSVDAEFIYRYASNLPDGFRKNYTYRLVTGASYKVSDAITLKFNFGTNFDGNSATYTQAKKILAIGGINLGLLSFSSTGVQK